jgi:hypothetical protein
MIQINKFSTNFQTALLIEDAELIGVPLFRFEFSADGNLVEFMELVVEGLSVVSDFSVGFCAPDNRRELSPFSLPSIVGVIDPDFDGVGLFDGTYFSSNILTDPPPGECFTLSSDPTFEVAFHSNF